MKTTSLDETVVDLLKNHEGYRRFNYLCPSGFNTVGYGRNMDTKGLSEAEATYLLKNDIQEATAQVIKSIPQAKNLSPERKAVLIMMVFNMGLAGVLGFKKMLSAIEKGDYNEAGKCMLDSRWATQVKGRAHQLAEAMITGKL